MITRTNLIYLVLMQGLFLFYACEEDSIITPTPPVTTIDYSHLEGSFYTERKKGEYLGAGLAIYPSNYHFDQIATISVQDTSIKISNSVFISKDFPIDSVSQTVFTVNDWVLEYYNNYDSIRLYYDLSSPSSDTVWGVRDDLGVYTNSERSSIQGTQPIINYNLAAYKKYTTSGGVRVDTQFVATLPVKFTPLSTGTKFSVDGVNATFSMFNTYSEEMIHDNGTSIVKERYAYWNADTLSIEWIQYEYNGPNGLDSVHYSYRGVKD